MLIQLCVPTEVLPIVFSFFLLFMECIGIRNIIIQVNDQSVRNVSWRVSHGMCDQGRPQTASTPARSEQAYIFAYSVDESKQNNKKSRSALAGEQTAACPPCSHTSYGLLMCLYMSTDVNMQ